jgi:transcriptional regulator with XRE-family HTH domain
MGKPNKKLRELRGNKSQAEVAKAVGISPSAYAQYERGDRVPRDDIKKRLSDYYRRSVTFLFFND